MKSPLSIVAVLAVVLIAFSCSKDSGSGQNATCTTTKTFTNDALPAIQTYCATSGCHATGSSNGPGALTTYNQIYSNRAAISQSITSGRMPQGTTLPSVAYSNIICWINQGAANN